MPRHGMSQRRSAWRKRKLLLRETRERCEALEQSNAALRERIERSGDADRIAELARERLGLVLPDDRIYQ